MVSLWWAKREQLDVHQVNLIENLPLSGSHLIIGPPGSGKTNVLLRRAQFVRLQDAPNIMVLTFTRSLAEFLKTGCYSPERREIFPPALISTVETWLRGFYRANGATAPASVGEPIARRAELASGAHQLAKSSRIPKLDALFVDEAQDLIAEEIQLFRELSDNLFFVGDDRQKIYAGAAGLEGIRALVPPPADHQLPFHYRLVREICEMADRIQVPASGVGLSATQHYSGPTPGRISVQGPLSRADQISAASTRLMDQVRVYADLIDQGDRLGVIVPRKNDRDEIFAAFEKEPALAGRSQVVRARDGTAQDRDFDTVLSPDKPILIVTPQGSKGLEFRAVQWLFSDDLQHRYTPEIYYTVVTRAKTSLDIYFTDNMAAQIAKSYSPLEKGIW